MVSTWRQAQLDHYAAETSTGLTANEMRYLSAKILQDAEDLDQGEPATSVSQAMTRERTGDDE